MEGLRECKKLHAYPESSDPSTTTILTCNSVGTSGIDAKVLMNSTGLFFVSTMISRFMRLQISHEGPMEDESEDNEKRTMRVGRKSTEQKNILTATIANETTSAREKTPRHDEGYDEDSYMKLMPKKMSEKSGKEGTR